MNPPPAGAFVEFAPAVAESETGTPVFPVSLARSPPSLRRDRRRARAGLGISEGAGSHTALRRDAIFRRLLASADVVAAAAALLASAVLFGATSTQPWLFGLLPVVVLASKAMGLYDRDELLIAKTTLNEAPALFQLATLYGLVLVLVQSAVSSAPI